jgi:mono/diheme cytochrome c family protein
MNRRNSAARAYPLAATAWIALACGTVEDPQPDPSDAPPVVRQTCADNPLLAGCAPTDPTPATDPDGAQPSDDRPDPASELALARGAAENVLRANCGQCHGPALTPANARAGMNYIDDMDQLVENGKITPLSSADSLIVVRMKNGSMPPVGSTGPRPSSRDIDTVAEFIDNPVFWPDYRPATACDGQFISIDDVYSEVQSDVRSLEGRDRPFARYLTLTNRYNAGVCSPALDRDRFAMNKLVNSLSTDSSVTAPVAIDDNQLVYRIDLRDYGWDEQVNVGGQRFDDGWEAIIAASPYAIPFVGDEADDLRNQTLTDVTIMSADAMLDAAALGDTYYALIGVDTNRSLGDFIDSLGIDVAGDLDDGTAARAGTTRSQISREDRVIERHEIGVRQGAFWQSFDVEAGGGDSIFTDPFGFNQGGTEAIFTLRNGMLGYIIGDANDNIVGESNVLLDTFQDDFVARTSVSCSNCHSQGFNNVVDEVKPFVLENRRRFQRDDFEGVEQLYPDPADFAQLIESDSSNYLVALRRAELPVTGSDPVAATYLRFNLDVDLATAAGELGVTAQDLRKNLNLIDPALAVLRQISVDRDDFTAAYAASLCRLQTISANQPDPDLCDQLLDD